MTVARPWRAIAYVPDPLGLNGRAREVAGRVAAKSREGLDRFVDEHRSKGNAVDVEEVRDLFDVDTPVEPRP